MAVCTAVTDIFVGSHAKLEALFEAAGVPGPLQSSLSHELKWKTLLCNAGNNPDFDGLAVLGNLIGEFMDLNLDPGVDWYSPGPLFNISKDDPEADYARKRERIIRVLENHGLRYYPGGRVLRNGEIPQAPAVNSNGEPRKPSTLEELLEVLVRGLPRAMYPLTHRRTGASTLSFDAEHDLQDLLHSHLRPWIADIRPEEFTPSYAGSSKRMDFLLPTHKLVIETKRVRDPQHALKIGDELIIDIEHYRRHDGCDRLWCVVYDPKRLIRNPSGLVNDLEGYRSTPPGKISVRVIVISG
jgi:hypothetical protein